MPATETITTTTLEPTITTTETASTEVIPTTGSVTAFNNVTNIATYNVTDVTSTPESVKWTSEWAIPPVVSQPSIDAVKLDIDIVVIGSFCRLYNIISSLIVSMSVLCFAICNIEMFVEWFITCCY